MNAWNELAARVVDWLVSTSWQAAVLAVLVAGVQVVFRKVLSARWRYLLWILVVARLLFPSLPESSMSLYRYVPVSPVVPIHFDQVASPIVAAPASGISGPPPYVPSVSAPPESARIPISAKGVLFAIWLAGFLALMVALIERNLRFRRRVLLDARPAGDARRKLADSVARGMGMKRRLVVIETDLIETPAVVGLFVPKLLLPGEVAARLSPDELALIFRHELAHLKRGDLWVNFLVCVLQVVHWFNPALWWAFGRMRHDRELATDALALRWTHHSQQAYGETLIKLAAGKMPRASLNPAIGILENHRHIRQRVEQIARLKPNAYAWSGFGAATLVILGLLALTKAPALATTAPAPTAKDAANQEAFTQDFYRPVSDGNIDQVRAYLDHGASPNAKVNAAISFGPSGAVPYGPVLFSAVANRHEDVVRLLLARGARPNDKSGWGETPVHRALANGDKSIAGDLIAAGAKYDPLQYLVATGDVAGLEKKNAAQPFTPAQINTIMGNATTAGQLSVLAWAWPKAKLDAAKATKKRGDLLQTAAQWGRLDVAQYLARQGVDFPKVGRDAFETAIQGNFPEIARFIAEKDPAAFDAQRNLYPFRDAAGLGRIEIVRLLLGLGYNIDTQDSQGMTPLSWAAYLQQDDVCKFLVERGADIAIRDKTGENAAWYAAFGAGCPQTLKLLLDRHIDLGGRNSNGWPIMVEMLRFSDPRPDTIAFPGKIYTAAEIAEAHQKQREVIGLLAHAGADLNARSSIGSPLTVAIQGGKIAIAEALIQNGADVRAPDGRGYSPLVSAVKVYSSGLSLPFIQLLLDKGADVNTTSVYVYDKPPLPPQSVLKSLLLREASLDEPDPAFADVLKLLLARGAHFTAPVSGAGNRWLSAAATGDLDQLKALKAQGVPVDTSDGDRWTALDTALAAGQTASADWLLQSGARANSATADGHDALYFAVGANNLGRIDRLLAAGADAKSSPALALAASKGYLPMVRRLIDAGGDGKTISIYDCIRNGNAEIARLALEHGANPDPHDNGEKRYNVYWALSYRQPEILKMILDRGADPTVKTVYDETPLNYAQKWWPGMVPVIQDALKKWGQRGASTTDRFGRPTVDVTVTPVPPPGIKWVKIAMETQGGSSPWQVSSGGTKLQAQLPAGGYPLRTVCRVASGQLYFSACHYLRVTDAEISSGQPVQADFATTLPGFNLEGQVDPSVPRPIKNGVAIACVSTGMTAPNIHTWLMWSKSAPVHADGAFEISNLPPPAAAIATDDTAGPLQLIVTCDGYVSKDPAAAQFEYAAGSQTFAPPIAQSLTIAMEPDGGARARVLDPNGKPVPDALVQFSPNETFRNGSVLWYSTMLGSTQDDEKQLFNEETPLVLGPGEIPPYQRLLARYQAVTNPDGFAELAGLPPGLVSYTVEKTSYDMPYRLRLPGSWTKYAQDAIVTVKSGLQATTEIRLIPKIAPIRIADSTSPDGKYVVSVESGRDSGYSGTGPQSVVLRDAKTGEFKSATFLPANSQNQEDLVTASNKLVVKWNRASSFFGFAAWHTDHFDVLGVILSPQQNQLGLVCSNLSQGMDGKVTSCDFVDPNTLHIEVLGPDGKTSGFYWTMNTNGGFEGSSSPPARKV